jgi:hypothetical protein
MLVALAVTGTDAQQSEPPLKQPRTVEIAGLQDLQRPDVPDPPEPPAGANAWSLIVHTTGGFTGRGVGTVTISSDGRMVCPAACASLGGAQMRLISSSVDSIQGAAWVSHVPTGFCRDCVFTTVVLKRREGDGVRTYIASWDDSQSVTPELRELRRLALELRIQRK